MNGSLMYNDKRYYTLAKAAELASVNARHLESLYLARMLPGILIGGALYIEADALMSAHAAEKAAQRAAEIPQQVLPEVQARSEQHEEPRILAEKVVRRPQPALRAQGIRVSSVLTTLAAIAVVAVMPVAAAMAYPTMVRGVATLRSDGSRAIASIHLPSMPAMPRFSMAQLPGMHLSFGTGTSLGSIGSFFAGVRSQLASVFVLGEQTPSGDIATSAPPLSASKVLAQNALATFDSTTTASTTTSVQPIYYVYNYPVIERIKYEAPGISASGSADYDTKLQELYNRIENQIVALSAANSTQNAQTYQVIAQTNRIDQLSSVNVSSSNINGGTITGASISGGSFSGSVDASTLSAGSSTLATTTINGDLTLSGSLNVSGGSSSITSSGAVFTNATSTNLFATLAHFTTGIIDTLTATAANITGLTATNATTTNATSTNFYTTNLASSLASTTNLVFTNATGTTLNLSGDETIGGNLTVNGNTITLGTTTSNALVINSAIKSNLIPDQNITYDLGSPSFYWRNVYVGTITANNISAASTSIGGTASNDFTINSDNVSSDAENMNLIFFRGNVVPNALLTWNSAANKKRFEFNQSLAIANASGSTTNPTLTVTGTAGQSANILQIASSTGTNLFEVTSEGNVGVGTTSPWASLSVNPNGIAGPAFVVGSSTATNFIITNAGTVGIGTTSPNDAMVQIGDGSYNPSAVAGLLVSRNISASSAPHGVAVNDTLNQSVSGSGYASFDTRTQWTGTTNYDHGVSLQSFPVFGSSGTMQNYYGFLHSLTVNNGTVVNAYGAELRDVTGTGSVTNNYGLYVDALSKGSANWAIWTNGTTASHFGGYLALGTTNTPSQLITIGGSSGQQQIYMERNSASSTGANLVVSAGGAGSGGTNLNGGDLILSSGISTGNGSSAIRFKTYNPGTSGTADASQVTWMSILGNGNVGIGTSNPAKPLDVVGAAQFAGNVNIGDSQRGFWIDNSGSFTYGISKSASGTSARLQLFANGTEGLSIDPTGKIGVGTTSPWAKLSVLSTAAVPQLVIGSSTTQFIIDKSGNVGIGTSSPATLLAVGGNGYLTGGLGVGVLNTGTGSLQTSGSAIIGGNVLATGYVDTSGTTGGYYIDGILTMQASSTNNDVFVGQNTGSAGDLGFNNISLGGSSLQNLTNGFNNIAVGFGTLAAVSSGAENAALGAAALAALTTGNDNVAVGHIALQKNITGSFNTSLGANSLFNNLSATNTVAVGYRAGYGNGGTYSNQGGVTVGYRSGFNFANGSDYNTLLGYQAGFDITSGAHNLILGDDNSTGNGITTGSNNILLGQDVRAGLSQTGSNQLNIGNLIFGTSVGSGAALGTGNVGIGTTSPWANLAVHANNGGTNTTLFAIASSTASATTTLFSVLNTGTTTITGGLAVAGGRTTDNNGNVNLGVSLGTAKCAIYASDNFNAGCAQVGAAIGGIINNDTNYNGYNVAYFNRNSNVNNLTTAGANATLFVGASNSSNGNNLAGTFTRINTNAVQSTGTSYGNYMLNYLQSGASNGTLSNFIGYYSTGQFATAGPTLTNQYDFRADDFTSQANGTTTNRYGVYLNFTKGTGTNSYGVYQVSPTVSNFFGGNVGIGTTTASTNLSVQGNGLLSGNLSVANLTATGTVTTANLTSTGLLSLANASTSLLSVFQKAYFGGTATSSFDNAGNLALVSNGLTIGTSQLVVSGGNVGVGTTSPNSLLAVQGGGVGSVMIGTLSDTSYGAISLSGRLPTTTSYNFASGPNDPTLYINRPTGGDIFFRENGGAAQVVIKTSTGNLGIGTSTPWAQLSLASVAGLPSFAIGSTTTQFIVDKNGNVGIGTTSPFANLSLHASNGSTKTTLFAIASSTASATTTLFSINNVGDVTSGNSVFRTMVRSLPVSGSEVDIGTFTFTNGAGALDVSVVVPSLGYSAAKEYKIPIQYQDVNSRWYTVLPISSTGPYQGADFALDVQVSQASASLRLRALSSSGGSAYIRILQDGVPSDTFTPSTASAVVAAPTLFYPASNLTIVGGNVGGSFQTGMVGIGTSTPFRTLSVTNTASAAQAAIAYDGTRYTELQTDASGDFHINPSGQDIQTDDSNLWVCSGGACPTGAPSGTGNAIVENKVGVGTSTPQVSLQVGNGGGAGLDGSEIFQFANNSGVSYGTIRSTSNTLYLGTQDGGSGTFLGSFTNSNLALRTAGSDRVTITSGGNVGVGTTSPSAQLAIQNLLYVGAGGATGLGTATSTFQGDIKITGKLDVGTIDPPYTIDGVKYATYGASTVGVHEEVVLKVVPSSYDAQRKLYDYAIDFSNLPQGSDAWLFYQVTDFGADWQNLVVTLTPGFDGRAFYEQDPAHHTLHILSDKEGPVSVRMIANRYDFTKWQNLRPDQDGVTDGTHVISSKPSTAQTAAVGATQ